MLFDEYKLSFEEHNTVLAEIRDFVFENKKPVFKPHEIKERPVVEEPWTVVKKKNKKKKD